MSETPDPLVPLGRLAAFMLAVILGVSLALYEPDEVATPAADAASGAPSATAGSAPTGEFESMLQILVNAARKTLTDRGDFQVIVAALGPRGLELRQDASPNGAVGPDVRLLRDRIEAGQYSAFGWAVTEHAPGERRPNAVYIEIANDNGQLRRRVMDFSRNTTGGLDFFTPQPASRMPRNAFFIDASRATSAQASPALQPLSSTASGSPQPGAASSPSPRGGADASRGASSPLGASSPAGASSATEAPSTAGAPYATGALSPAGASAATPVAGRSPAVAGSPSATVPLPAGASPQAPGH